MVLLSMDMWRVMNIVPKCWQFNRNKYDCFYPGWCLRNVTNIDLEAAR